MFISIIFSLHAVVDLVRPRVDTGVVEAKMNRWRAAMNNEKRGRRVATKNEKRGRSVAMKNEKKLWRAAMMNRIEGLGQIFLEPSSIEGMGE